MPEPLDQLTAALAERYRIERELGVGGMAIVYLARDIKHNRQVALKVIRPFSFFDAQYFVAMGFNKRTLTFFRQLALHNEKPWFEAHRDGYENDVRAPMRELIDELDVRFAQFAPEIGGDRKRSMFRINRDIRFSKDKSPYKTHAACWFYHRNASRAVGAEAEEGSAGFYFHLQPGESALGAGLWMPPRSQLNKLRAAIADDPDKFGEIVSSIPRRFGGLGDEAVLKRMPRGFDEDHPAAKWLRYQSFTTGRGLTDAEVTKDSLAALLANEYKALLPLVRWLNGALGFKPASRR